jgi:thioredoxin 1
MSKVINVKAGDFEKAVLKADKPVLVDFWADWCMPCKMMAPILDQLSEALGERLAIVKVDTEEPENLALAQQYRIMSIPNMKLFSKGNVVAEFIGLRSKEQLKRELENYLK